MIQRRRSIRSCAVAFVAAACTTVVWAQSPASDVDEQVEAIWHVQVVDFAYSSPTYYYACDALQARIAAVLRAVGAHRGVKVVMGCKDRSFVNTAFARILVASPIEATEEQVAAATTFTAQDELAARVRAEALPTAADIDRFVATRRELSLSSQPPLRLEASDCDLVRDLSEQVFPKLGVELTQRISCFSLATRLKPEVHVKALMQVSEPVVAEAEQ